MVGRADHAEPEAARFEHDGGAGVLEIGARADPRDAGGLEVGEGVEECRRPEVECVVVRDRHAVHTEAGERVSGRRRCSKVEHPAWRRSSTLGDAARG